MILKQYYLNCLAHASYLIGDEASHTAAIVDPQRDIDRYLADAAEHGLEIRHVFLTHFHADLSIVWPEILATAVIGAVYFGFALYRFRRVIFGS